MWPAGLNHTLGQNRVSGQLLQLIQSFLVDRMEQTILNGKASKWEEFLQDFHRDRSSHLGPLSFLIYIHVLTKSLKFNLNLFADDTSIFSIAQKPK